MPVVSSCIFLSKFLAANILLPACGWLLSLSFNFTPALCPPHPTASPRAFHTTSPVIKPLHHKNMPSHLKTDSYLFDSWTGSEQHAPEVRATQGVLLVHLPSTSFSSSGFCPFKTHTWGLQQTLLHYLWCPNRRSTPFMQTFPQQKESSHLRTQHKCHTEKSVGAGRHHVRFRHRQTLHNGSTISFPPMLKFATTSFIQLKHLCSGRTARFRLLSSHQSTTTRACPIKYYTITIMLVLHF